jgi:V/A-type H+-transporting ATPase subunit I
VNLRPLPTRWFELLTTHEDLARALETLAETGCIELELRRDVYRAISLQDLQERMQDYSRLARHYQPYWPRPESQPAVRSGSPGVILDAALRQLQAWEQAALPLIRRLESLSGKRRDLQLLANMLRESTEETLDYSLLGRPGPLLETRLYALPAGSRIGQLPDSVLGAVIHTKAHEFLVVVGTPAETDRLTMEMAAYKARSVLLPRALPGTRTAALATVEQRMDKAAADLQRLRDGINALAEPYGLAGALGDMSRLDWLLAHVTRLPVSENFAWITGWTSDRDDRRLSAALRLARVNAVIHFPSPPRDVSAPLVLQNPGWARPFEVFARMLGTPERDEADPSRLLAVLVPLLFGYMFGDVGHGLVLLVAGLFLQRRWPVLRLLVVNGAAAMVFGLVFGSVFGREDVLSPLWVHPLTQPLPVLLVPLVAGVAILVLGMLLQAVEAFWRDELRSWWRTDAAVLVLYLAIIASFLNPAAAGIALAATVWYFTGCLLPGDTSPRIGLPGAAGKLLESILQLLVNTVSFVRVGAFALAHGGLSLAFVTLAAATDNPVAGFLILLAGNLIVIMLEGLVVTIQTTRLILFEFFIRFLRAGGRTFRPLAAPTTEIGTRSTS